MTHISLIESLMVKAWVQNHCTFTEIQKYYTTPSEQIILIWA